MENLGFALNATTPVFLIILLGYILKKIGVINEQFIKPCNTLNFTVTLPVLLIVQLSKTDFINNLDIKFILYCMISTTLMFFMIYYYAKKTIKDSSKIGAFVQASFRGSAAVLGIAFIINVYNETGFAPLMIIAAVPLYNIYSVIVLSIEGHGKIDIKKTIKDIVLNPIIIGILIGIAVSIFNIKFPVIIDKSLNSIADLASPLALICIGASFNFKLSKKDIKLSCISVIIKLIVLPAIFLPFAYYLGFKDTQMLAILIMVASPTTPSCYIMAQQMANDHELTASIVVLSTLVASFTLTMWIYVLKFIGCM